MSISLSNISKIKNNNRKRVGRGIGSGTGKTSGRGVKGQKSRSGVSLKLFEGGQTPIYMRLPKKGFNSRSKTNYEVVNIKDVILVTEKNQIDSSIISKENLEKFGLISSKNSKIKLIMKDLETKDIKFKVEADFYSKNAQTFAS